ASLKMVVRDRQSLFWALAFPMIFLGVFRLFSFDSFGTTDLIVSLDDADQPAQQALVAALSDAEFLALTTVEGLDDASARTEIEDERADAVLLLRAEGDRVRATLLHDIGDPIGASVTEAGISSVVDRVNLGISLAGEPAPVEFASAVVEDDGGSSSFFEFLGPGIIGMGLMTFATISLAGSLSRYREEGVLRRIRATPLAPWRFFASVVAAHLVVAVVQVIVLALVAQALGAGVLAGGIWFLVVAVYGVLVFLNIGVIVAGRVQGRGAVEGAANAITMPMMFLSGAFFPTESMPDPVSAAVEVLPLTHMLRAMRALVDGQSIVEQWPSLLVLTGWVVVTTILARSSFSLRDQ
ncbi:MAG: ABC transporter permease, partial [Dehalococcoidia bacterium]